MGPGIATGVMAGGCNMSPMCPEASPCKDNHPLIRTHNPPHTHTHNSHTSVSWTPDWVSFHFPSSFPQQTSPFLGEQGHRRVVGVFLPGRVGAFTDWDRRLQSPR